MIILRIFFALLFISLANSVSSAETTAKNLVGVMTKQWTPRCVEKTNTDSSLEWTDPHYEAGFVRLIVSDASFADSFLNKPVMIRGQAMSGFVRADAQDIGACDFLQRREDWIYAKDGLRLKRDVPKNVQNTAAWQVESIELFPLIWHPLAKTFTLDLENPFSQDLQGVVVTAHYEGCYGKPNGRQIKKTFETIAPKKSRALEFPVFVIDEAVSGRSTHKIYSVQITAANSDILFDLDYRPSNDEAPWVCPEPEKSGKTPALKPKN